MKKVILVFLILQIVGYSSLMTMQKSHAEQLDFLSAALPSQIGLWTAESKDRMYDRETIFSYIDGAGEVYRAYNMRSCLSRRYTSPNAPAIVLDIFDMGTSEDAFGVFTHDRDGRAVDVGQGALYRPGWLSFWKGRFSRVVASLIKDQGPKPGLLLKLPPEGLQSRSIRYLHHHTLLNYHFYLADENILNYPNVEKAAEAHKTLLHHYLPEATSTAAVLLEDGKWSATGLKNKFLTVVLEADTRPLAENLLREVLETL
jgi:hypothetical protein